MLESEPPFSYFILAIWPFESRFDASLQCRVLRCQFEENLERSEGYTISPKRHYGSLLGRREKQIGTVRRGVLLPELCL
jgi:hypothetical protein